ncbi:unnamed protein product [Closterium sp. Yama58-4]|nr:unnamed protein product [Closterium sp. Yama58-4]
MENMFSSMACMAHALLGAPDVTPGKVERSYSLHWSHCNVTLTLIWSVFMVETAWVDPNDLFKGGQVDVSTADTTWTDVLPSYDIIVFNTGNWWKPRQLERYGLTLNPPFHRTSIVDAYPHALATILTALHRRRRFTSRAFLVTSVSFQFNASCPATLPIADVATARTTMAALTRRKNEVLKAGSSIRLLDVHDLSLFRHDARPAAFHGRQSSLHDCAHYCVPGVPDTWNELLLGMMVDE